MHEVVLSDEKHFVYGGEGLLCSLPIRLIHHLMEVAPGVIVSTIGTETGSIHAYRGLISSDPSFHAVMVTVDCCKQRVFLLLLIVSKCTIGEGAVSPGLERGQSQDFAALLNV